MGRPFLTGGAESLFLRSVIQIYRKFCDFVGSVMPTIDRSRSPKSPSQNSVGIKSPVSVGGF